MSQLLIIAGAVIAVVGIVFMPLPGPGYLGLVVGVILLLAGLLARYIPKQVSRQKSGSARGRL